MMHKMIGDRQGKKRKGRFFVTVFMPCDLSRRPGPAFLSPKGFPRELHKSTKVLAQPPVFSPRSRAPIHPSCLTPCMRPESHEEKPENAVLCPLIGRDTIADCGYVVRCAVLVPHCPRVLSSPCILQDRPTLYLGA
jgi:hypothetical protein